VNDTAVRARVLLVLTRPIPAAPNSGRERTLAFIQNAVASRFELRSFQLDDALRSPAPARALRMLARLLRGLLSGMPCPLQVALFEQGGRRKLLRRTIEEFHPDAVYFDGIRSVDALLDTRARFPELRLICDFDDLMSLRYETLLQRRLSISLGYLRERIPRLLQDFLQRGFVTRAVLAYEALSLRNMETRAVAAADAVTVVSSTDIVRLRANAGPALATRTHVIPPGVLFPQDAIRTNACRGFIFVGSDVLLQNRMSIEFLLELWSRVQPARPLRIVGRMTGSYPAIAGVTFTGFVRDIGDVYHDGCIVLCPSFVEGGIKTKVLEALGQGVIPVGNALTFEGMGCDPGALALRDTDFATFVRDPEALMPTLKQAASAMRACVEGGYSFDAVTRAWSRLLQC